MDKIIVYTEEHLIPARQHYPPWNIKLSDLQSRYYDEFRRADYVVYLDICKPYVLKNRYGSAGHLTIEESTKQKELLEAANSVVEIICGKQQRFLADVVRNARHNNLTHEYINMAVLTLQRCWYVSDSVSSVVLNELRTKFQK